jgi:hypothetical protein
MAGIAGIGGIAGGTRTGGGSFTGAAGGAVPASVVAGGGAAEGDGVFVDCAGGGACWGGAGEAGAGVVFTPASLAGAAVSSPTPRPLP